MDICEISQKESLQIHKALGEIFGHIKSVQEDISTLNLKSMQKVNDFLFKLDIEIDEETFVALQHQDILTQQLKAVSELVEALQDYMRNYQDEQTLESKFLCALEIAKAKKEAYRGKAF